MPHKKGRERMPTALASTKPYAKVHARTRSPCPKDMEPHIIIAHMVMETLFILPAPFLRSSAVRCKALIALHDIIISIKLSTKIFLQRDGITAFAPSGRTKAAAPPFSPAGASRRALSRLSPGRPYIFAGWPCRLGYGVPPCCAAGSPPRPWPEGGPGPLAAPAYPYAPCFC